MNPEEKEVQKENTGGISNNTPAGHDPIKSLRTYQGDVENAISHNKFSSTSIFLAEQKRKNSILLNIDTPKNSEAKNKFFVFIGGIMLILGVITVIAVLYIKSKEEVITVQKTRTIIGFSTEKVIQTSNSTKDKLVTEILAEKKAWNLPVNSVLYFNTVNSSGNSETAENLLLLMAPRIPLSLARSFDGEYMLGIYSFDTNEPFIILKTDDFASSFSGMLKWEKDMIYDFDKLFSISQNIASTTAQFKDVTLRNKDIRILQNNNNTVLLYSFINKSTLVITTNENILNAIIGKYNIKEQVR